MLRRIYHYIKYTLLAIIMFIISQIATSLISLSLMDINNSFKLSSNVLLIILIINIAIMVFWAKKINILPFDLTFLTKKNVFWIISLFILGRFLVIILALQLPDSTYNDALIQELFANAPKLLTFTTIAIAAPIMEEIVFRGVIIGKIFNQHPIIGLIVSSSLFSYVHSPESILSFSIYFLLGATLATAYIKTKRLESSMLIHFLNNLPGALFIILS